MINSYANTRCRGMPPEVSASAELLSRLPAAVYTCDAQGRVTFFNDAAAELWGRRPQLGKDLWCGSWRIYEPDGTPMAIDACPMAVALREAREVHGRQIIIERPDGTRRHVLPHPQLLWKQTPKGAELVGALNLLVDVTPHNRAEQKLRANQQLYRKLLTLMPAAVYTCSAPDGKITYFNDRAVALWGRRPVAGATHDRYCGSHQLYTPDGRPLRPDECPMVDALRDGRVTRNSEVILERPDGSRSTVLVNIDPIRAEDGGIEGAINVFHDITESKQAEEDRAHLAAIVDSSDDAIISKTLEGTITSWNKGAERLFGYTADEAIGRSVTMLIPPDRLQEEEIIIERVAQGQRVDDFKETVRVRKDGTTMFISLTVSPVLDPEGRVIGASKIARDITQQKRVELELQQYRDRLQELVEQRTQELAEAQEKLINSERNIALGTIAAGLGHDIGNLLMPMATHLHAIREHHSAAAEDIPELAERFQSMTKAFDYLRNMAAGLRMMAVDPTRSQRSMWQATDVGAWWEEALPLLKTALTGSFELEHEFASDLPPVALPKPLLTQVVFNIVQNAGRAMAGQRDGRVVIQVDLEANETMLRMSIRDNGPGMTDEVKRRCMEPFFTTKTRGISSGLGLALVNGIIQDAGGTLEVESSVGEGSSFIIRLPIEAPAAARDQHQPLAVIAVANARLGALLRHELASVGFEIANSDLSAVSDDPTAAPQLAIVDGQADSMAAADNLLRASSSARVVLIRDEDQDDEAFSERNRVTVVKSAVLASDLRAHLRRLASEFTHSP